MFLSGGAVLPIFPSIVLGLNLKCIGPILVRSDVDDGVFAHPKLLRQSNERPSRAPAHTVKCLQPPAYLHDLLGVELAMMQEPTLGDGIADVIALGANLEMAGIDASGVVARVHQHFVATGRQIVAGQHPSYPVGIIYI